MQFILLNIYKDSKSFSFESGKESEDSKIIQAMAREVGVYLKECVTTIAI